MSCCLKDASVSTSQLISVAPYSTIQFNVFNPVILVVSQWEGIRVTASWRRLVPALLLCPAPGLRELGSTIPDYQRYAQVTVNSNVRIDVTVLSALLN
jgi:hypothetical protein